MQDSGGQVFTSSSRDCRSVFCEEGQFTFEQVDLTLQSFTLCVWISFISKLGCGQFLTNNWKLNVTNFLLFYISLLSRALPASLPCGDALCHLHHHLPGLLLPGGPLVNGRLDEVGHQWYVINSPQLFTTTRRSNGSVGLVRGSRPEKSIIDHY